MIFNVVIDPDVINDIQDAMNFYNEQEEGLGSKFENALNKHLITLRKNPFFRIRYDDVRCLPMKKYPYMIHFTVDNKNHIVIIRAIFHTSRNPDIWQKEK